MLSLTQPGATPEQEHAVQLRDNPIAQAEGLEQVGEVATDEDGDWDGRELIKQVERFEKTSLRWGLSWLVIALLLVIAMVSVFIVRGRAPWDLRTFENPEMIILGIWCGSTCLAFGFLVAGLLQCYNARRLRSRLRDLKEELRQGTALLLWYSHEQWQSFVDMEFGPQGRRMQEEWNGTFLGQCCMFLLMGGGIMLIFFVVFMVKSGGSVHFGQSFDLVHDQLPWWTLPAVALPFAFLFAFVRPCVVKRQVRLQHRRLSGKAQPIIMGSQTFVFDQLLLFKSYLGYKLLDTAIVTLSTYDRADVERAAPEIGKLVQMKYQVGAGKNTQEKMVLFPIPFGRENEVHIWIQANPHFYLNKPTVRGQVVQGVKVVVKAGKILHHIIQAAS